MVFFPSPSGFELCIILHKKLSPSGGELSFVILWCFVSKFSCLKEMLWPGRRVWGIRMDNEKFFIATKADLRRIREKLGQPETCGEAKEMLKQILGTKERLFWETDSPGGGAAVFSLSGELLRQVRVIEGILEDLAEKNISRALSKLDWYEENVVIPEDEKEIQLVQGMMHREENKKPSAIGDPMEALLAFEQCFFDYKQQIFFSKVVGPRI
jgi:hypothetical protein